MARDEQTTLAAGERLQRVRAQRIEFDTARIRRQLDQTANRQARQAELSQPDQTARENEWRKLLDRNRVATASAERRPAARRDYGRMGSDLQEFSPSTRRENALDALSRIGSFDDDSTTFARAARYGQLRGLRGIAGRGADGAMALAMEEAQAFVEQAYKRVWQSAQEAVEDFALSFADFFIFSGPAALAIYFARWIGGNVMGGMLRKTISAPAPFNTLVPSIEVQLVPSYSVADPLDLVRHIKILIIGGLTLLVYGFIVMLMYMISHPDLVAKIAALHVWQSIINLFQSLVSQFTASKT